MLKVDLHTHTADDPVDDIPYTTFELIDRAAALGYEGLAITLHEKQLDIRPFAAHAAERGIVLVPGIERTIEGRHVLLLNFSDGAEDVATFADLARLKRRRRGLVIAPHAYFPSTSCLRGALERHADLFDVVERNAMYTRAVDFNRRAERWAEQHGKPVVGNGDVHRLMQLGTTHTLVDAEKDADAICHAIINGHVIVESRPLSTVEAARIASALVVGFDPERLVNEIGQRWQSVETIARSIAGTRVSGSDISQS